MWEPWDFEPSRPREARGGIKAQSKRGEFGESWWAKRWISVLEGFDIGARLGRGRSYARWGQVLSIQIENGWVRAEVQGSRPEPYEIAIQCKTLSADDWAKVVRVLSRQALFTAKLLAGAMPNEIEQVFQEAGLSLFPSRLGDLTTECSCPDWSNPCKHIAAVYYLLGEEFDRDPFLIFALRGLPRDELFALLDRVDGSEAPRPKLASTEPATSPPEPLAADLTDFWSGPGRPDDPSGIVETPPVAAALIKRLGAFPFWRGNIPFLDAMEITYTRASTRGLDLVLGRGASTAATGPDTSPPA